jgi:hypothetical protein
MSVKSNQPARLRNIIIAGLGVAGTAIIGSIVTTAFSASSDRKADAIAGIDRQINDLYGPLDGYIQNDSTRWAEFSAANGAADHAFFARDPADEGDVVRWRNYIRSNSLPNLQKMTALISDKRSLIVGEGYPAQFQALARHTNGYEELAGEWAAAGAKLCPEGTSACEALYQSENRAQTPWPVQLKRCIQEDLAMLRRRRAEISAAVFFVAAPELARSSACDAPG